jgi:hypothetical protein
MISKIAHIIIKLLFLGTLNLDGTIKENKDIHIKGDTSISTNAITYIGVTKLDGSLNSDGNVILDGKAELSYNTDKIKITIHINGTVIPVA